MTDRRPDDMELQYTWAAASVPPPEHYEFSIRIGPGSNGELHFSPDYPGDGVPRWTALFDVNSDALDALYRLIVSLRVTTQPWSELERPPVGDDTSSLRIHLHRTTYFMHSQMERYDLLEPLCKRIKALVPTAIWAEMSARRTSYIAEWHN